MTTGRINQIATRQPIAGIAIPSTRVLGRAVLCAARDFSVTSSEHHCLSMLRVPTATLPSLSLESPSWLKSHSFTTLHLVSEEGIREVGRLKASHSTNRAIPISFSRSDHDPLARGHATATSVMPSLSGRHPHFRLSPNDLEVSGKAFRLSDKTTPAAVLLLAPRQQASTQIDKTERFQFASGV